MSSERISPMLKQAIATLLINHTEDEIIEALDEVCSQVKDKALKRQTIVGMTTVFVQVRQPDPAILGDGYERS